MAQIERTPVISKTAKFVLDSIRHQARSSYRAIGVASSLFFASSSVFGLGLGVLNVDSNLDQPLSGLITINVAPGDDLSTLSATVASREEFETLGIDYPDYLNSIKLSVERSGAGAVLRVSSEGVVIKEPFIHFLVKVSWSGGSFLREYTALIDPPVYAAETPRAISKPKSVGTDQSYDTSPDVTLSYDDDSAITLESVDSIDEAVDDTVAPIDNNYVDEALANTSDVTDARYGPVAAGESLSQIASELQRQVPDLSIYAIMQVLYEDNPDAFIAGNINGLIKGSILNIRDINQIRSADLQAARDFFSAQVAAWDPSALKPSSDSNIGVGQDTYTPGSDLFGSESTTSFNDVSDDSFQIGTSENTDSFVSAGQGDSNQGEVLALRQEISQLETSLASSQLENQELNDRINMLEGQLADMNRLASLNVEDADLASLEATLAQQAQTEEAASASAADGAISEFLSDDSSQGGSVIAPIDEASPDDLLDEFLTEGNENALSGDTGSGLSDELTDAVEQTGDALVGAVDDTQSALQGAADNVTNPTTAPTVNINKPAVDASESLLDKMGGIVTVLGGIGALLLAGLGLFLFRRKRADEEFEISMLSIESNSQSIDIDTESGLSASMSASVMASTMSSNEDDIDGEHSTDKETSFLTVYSDSDAVVQADEVDPIAEADVYIAYGRDEQAEEVLLDGVASHPDRVDVKQKLMNLYFKNKNAEGFERIAEELFAQRDSMSGSEWQEISDMGKELVPENPLFDLSGVDFDVVEGAESIDDLLSGETQVGLSDSENSSDDSDSLEQSTLSMVDADEDDDLLVFDAADDTASNDRSDSRAESESASEVNQDSELLMESINDDASIQLINFDEGRSEISELDEVEIDALSIEEGDDGSVLEFASNDDDDEALTFNDDDLALTMPDSNSSFEKQPSDDLSEDDLVLNFDSDEDDEDDEERNFSEVPEVSDLIIDPEYDEAQTQYELAKVFVDLGDDDGARKILQELVSNSDNSDEIISQSQELLDSMNG